MPGVMPSPQSWGSNVMENLVRHIYEPSKLILAWQAPDGLGNRTRYAVGEIVRSSGVFVLRYYVDTPDVVKAKALGYEGYAAFNLKQTEHSKDVLAAFMRRLPPRSRADFSQYLEGLRLAPMGNLSDFALLGYSEAKLPSDGFSLVNPLDEVGIPNEFLFELAGYRHHEPSLTKSDMGAAVALVPETANPFDPNAVVIQYKGKTIGYINRLQAPTVGRWLRNYQVSAVREKLNGRPDKPRAFIFLRTS